MEYSPDLLSKSASLARTSMLMMSRLVSESETGTALSFIFSSNICADTFLMRCIASIKSASGPDELSKHGIEGREIYGSYPIMGFFVLNGDICTPTLTG